MSIASEPSPITPTGVSPQVSSALASAADIIRSDSRIRGRLTRPSRLISVVGPDLKPLSLATAFAVTPGFEDIKTTIGVGNQTFFYSEKFVPQSQAPSLVRAEEVRSLIVDKVRKDSSDRLALTSLTALAGIPGAEADKIDPLVSPILEDERYGDIHLLSDSRGTRYLYSQDFMTDTYASVLAMAEADDPISTIALTVRDDSSRYPRPTPLSTFLAPIFRIDPRQLENYAYKLVSMPEHSDIKLIHASNGTPYLYSERYLTPAWVKATVEWEEVEKFSNP